MRPRISCSDKWSSLYRVFVGSVFLHVGTGVFADRKADFGSLCGSVYPMLSHRGEKNE